MQSANSTLIEALRWAAMEKNQIAAAAVKRQSFEDHHSQLCLALALQRKRLLTVKNTEVNDGLEAYRGLNVTCDSNNKGRQQIRM